MNPLVTLAFIVFLAFLVEAATGFGSVVVALTLGALWFSVNELLGWLVPVNMVLSAYLVARGWRWVKWRFLGTRMLPLMAVGLAFGTVVAARATQTHWLKPAFGLFVMAVAAWQLSTALRPAAVVSALPGPARVAALLGAGVIHGIFATGGPLAVFVAARELPEKAAFRGTLSMLWLVLNALVMPRLVFEGQVSAATLQTSGLMLLPLALGIAAGEWVHHRLAEAPFRVVVAVLLLAAGGVLVAQSFRRQEPSLSRVPVEGLPDFASPRTVSRSLLAPGSSECPSTPLAGLAETGETFRSPRAESRGRWSARHQLTVLLQASSPEDPKPFDSAQGEQGRAALVINPLGVTRWLGISAISCQEAA